MEVRTVILISMLVFYVGIRTLVAPYIIDNPVQVSDDKIITTGSYNPITNEVKGQEEMILEHETTHQMMRPLLLLYTNFMFNIFRFYVRFKLGRDNVVYQN